MTMVKLSGLDLWKSQLREDGKAALRSLLNGTAPLGRLSAAEPEDAMDAILGIGGGDPILLEAFDKGCAALVEEFRSTLFLQDERVFRIELAKLTSLMSVIRRLLPKGVIVDFHQRYVLWSGFFENFVLDRGLDLRREYFRILALSQDVADEAGLADRRLMPLWLSICAESGNGGRYDGSYLRVALLGLRRLPLGDEFDANEDFALQGLARWAVSQRPSKDAFEREWRILEGDFPREPAFWKNRVKTVISAAERQLSERTGGSQTTFPIADWWRQDLIIDSKDDWSKSVGAKQPPAREDREAILDRMNSSFETLKPRIDTLISAHVSYARSTGDVFYLVRTACNIGMKLLNTGNFAEKTNRSNLAVRLASLAFEFDPINVFAWSLMRDALASAGRVKDAELVGWEAIRRFPEDLQWRTQLATVLTVNSGRAEEAAALLRETVLLFPGNPYARNQLAAVLADDLQKSDDALQVLNDAVAAGVANEVTGDLLRKLGRGNRLRGKRMQRAQNTDASVLVLPTASGRRQLFLFEAGLATKDDVRAFLAETPQDSYSTYVADRVGVSDVPVKATFALAFEAALKVAKPSALRALISQARPMERAIIEEAIAAGEGRVVAFSRHFPEAEENERLEKLELALRQEGGSKDRSLVLLRDFAASMLSTGIVQLLAA